MIPPLKDIAFQANEMAKTNLTTYGYLEKVVLAFSDKKLTVNALQWINDEEKQKTIGHFLAKMKKERCELYVMVGEASVREISPQGAIQRDCILITAETRAGEKLIAMTPIVKDGRLITFEKTNWMDVKGNEYQFNLLKGIFDNSVGEKKPSASELEAMRNELMETARKKSLHPSFGVEFKEYTNRILGLSFKYPANWTIFPATKDRGLYIFNDSVKRSFPESVAIMILPRYSSTLIKFSQSIQKKLRKTLKQLEVMQESSLIKLSNSSAIMGSYKGIYKGHLIKLLALQGIKNQSAYTITFRASTTVFDKSLPLYEELIQSFKLTESE